MRTSMLSLTKRTFLGCAVCAICLTGHHAVADDVQPLTSPEDLRDLLRDAQWWLLPQTTSVVYDAGSRFFYPATPESKDFLESLTPIEQPGIASVTVYEDARTYETVFLDKSGTRVKVLSPESNYIPFWPLSMLPNGPQPDTDISTYDPALVSIYVTLLPLFPPVENAAGEDSLLKTSAGEGLSSRASSPAGELLSESLNSSNQSLADVSSSTDKSSETNAPSSSVSVADISSYTVYVDAKSGRDGWSGRREKATRGSGGPKKTIKGGRSIAQNGDRLVIREGRYAEGLNVRGTGINVRFKGDVSLIAASDSSSESGKKSVVEGVQESYSPTGSVVRVAN